MFTGEQKGRVYNYNHSVTISSFPFLYFFMSLAIQALPDSSLLTTYVS